VEAHFSKNRRFEILNFFSNFEFRNQSYVHYCAVIGYCVSSKYVEKNICLSRTHYAGCFCCTIGVVTFGGLAAGNNFQRLMICPLPQRPIANAKLCSGTGKPDLGLIV
jgi:hypothetical protein